MTSSSQRQRHPHSSLGLLANTADYQAQQYQRYIEQNETIGKGIAMRLTKGERFESIIGVEFAEQYRSQLKELARDNVSKERQLKAYTTAIQAVIAGIEVGEDGLPVLVHPQAENQENISPNIDQKDEVGSSSYEYKGQMEDEFAKAMNDIDQNSVLVTQEKSYLSLLKELGEDKVEDDELAVVNNNDDDNVLQKIKCPLTMQIMSDPVRSKMCGHSYDRDAIVHHITSSLKSRKKNARAKCPFPGCHNTNMKLEELEDDPETAMRIRRYKKRQSAVAKQEGSNDNSFLDVEDDDEAEAEF